MKSLALRRGSARQSGVLRSGAAAAGVRLCRCGAPGAGGRTWQALLDDAAHLVPQVSLPGAFPLYPSQSLAREVPGLRGGHQAARIAAHLSPSGGEEATTS